MDASDYMRFAASLAFVLALLGGGALALRYLGALRGATLLGRGSSRRLEIVETLFLDPKRRLVLIRRDGMEHLLILGAAHEGVVECGIACSSSNTAPVEPAIGVRAER